MPYHPLLRGADHILAYPSRVVTVAQHHHPNPDAARFADGQLHALGQRNLAQIPAAVDESRGRGLAHHLNCAAEFEGAGADALPIFGHSQHAVGVVTDQIALDQGVGQALGDRRRCAVAEEDAFNLCAQMSGRDDDHLTFLPKE